MWQRICYQQQGHGGEKTVIYYHQGICQCANNRGKTVSSGDSVDTCPNRGQSQCRLQRGQLHRRNDLRADSKANAIVFDIQQCGRDIRGFNKKNCALSCGVRSCTCAKEREAIRSYTVCHQPGMQVLRQSSFYILLSCSLIALVSSQC